MSFVLEVQIRISRKTSMYSCRSCCERRRGALSRVARRLMCASTDRQDEGHAVRGLHRQMAFEEHQKRDAFKKYVAEAVTACFARA